MFDNTFQIRIKNFENWQWGCINKEKNKYKILLAIVPGFALRNEMDASINKKE